MQDFNIDISEEMVLKLIGYTEAGQANNDVVTTVQELIAEAKLLAQPKVIYQELSFQILTDGQIRVGNEAVFTSHYLVDNLQNCQSLVVLAMTVGKKLHQRIEDLSAKDPFNGYILDIIGAYLIEVLSDKTWQKMKQSYQDKGRNTTIYYSPGVHDFSLEQQWILFSILRPEEIGMELTESYLMIPQKSLTGLVGIGEDIEDVPLGHDCAACDREYCFLREAIR